MTKEEKLVDLFTDRSGILTKVKLYTNSLIGAGSQEEGSFSLYEHEEGPMLLCFGGMNTFIKTSPIQEIELVEEVDGNTRVLFQTRTSTYEAIIFPLTEDNDDDKVDTGE